MKNTLAFLIAAGFALAGAAQPADDEAAERARIATERARVEAEFEAAHRACYQRFAVNDCISDARAVRREQMADLRRQELALNDAERRRRAAERLRDIESRTPPQPRGAASAAGAQEQGGPQEQRDTRERAVAPAPPASSAAPAVPRPAGKPRAAQSRTPEPAQRPDTAENLRRYNERLRQAQEHKAKVEQRAAEDRKDARPLPVPP